ncbi:MAG: LarC family nickel insertion protein [Planctomycetota bacterium]
MHRHADDAPPYEHPPQTATPAAEAQAGTIALRADADALPERLRISERHLHIDPFSGIAGDMFLAALLDLRHDADAELRQIDAAMRGLELDDPYELSIQRVQRCGVGGLDLKVKTQHHHPHTEGDAGHHQHHLHVGYTEIMAMVDKLRDAQQLSPRCVERATRVVTALADAEARVHGTTREAIHFHEVGAVDSIVDMLGSVLALERLSIDTVTCGPVPMSRGYVKCDHGLMPVPAPATAYLLQGVPTVGVDRTGELVTPTGAALLAGLVDAFVPAPPMTLNGVGYGAGDREDPLVPNLLRVFLGTPTKAKPASPQSIDKRFPRGATTLV